MRRKIAHTCPSDTGFAYVSLAILLALPRIRAMSRPSRVFSSNLERVGSVSLLPLQRQTRRQRLTDKANYLEGDITRAMDKK
jgi:hypothetical protein